MSDAERLRGFYAGVDLNLRLHGAEHMGRRNVFVRLARYTANASIDWAETTRIVARIADLDSWYPAWADAAGACERRGDRALERGAVATAADQLVRAAQLYHWAQINVRPEDARKEEGRRRSIAAYRRAAPLVDPPAQELAVPYGGRELPGYLRVPPGEEPCDLVVLVDGANSVKEELHLWTDAMLARGLATTVFDGPGQGEAAPALGGLPLEVRGYERAISAVIDAAAERLGGRLGAVGLWGNSFGGYLVARGAAHDDRVRAAVSLGGFADFRDFPVVPIPVQEELRDLMSLDSIDETIAVMDVECSLDDCAIEVPFLVVHGASDDLVGVAEARDLAGAAGERGELVVFDDGVHCCYNRYLELRTGHLGLARAAARRRDDMAPSAVGALDLRDWVQEVKETGELVELPGVSADLEIGAITDLNAKHRGPALLFTDIPGYEGRGRVLSCSLSRPARLALGLGLDPSLDEQGLVRALRGKPGEWLARASAFPASVVSDGPVLEHVVEKDELDMTEFPAPLWHEGDGGRYLGTGGGVITRAPEEDWVNVGTYRVCVHDARTLGVFIEPIHHGAIQMQQWHERGEPCPVVVSFGHHPLLYLASSMPMPWGTSELTYAGAMAGRPVEVVEGEVTGLPIPAAAELAIEGFVHPGDMADEGPFGEFTGYFAGGRHPRPVIRVERVYWRSDPIVYGSLPARPPFDHSYWRATVESSMLLDGLTAAGVPEVKAVWKHEAGCANFFAVVAIRQRYAGHSRQAGLVAATAAAGASMGRYVVVVDEDVDVTDLEEVIWAMSTRTDPVRSVQVIDGLPTNPLDPMLLDLDEPWSGSRAIVDACRPYDRRDDFPAVVEVSEELAAQVRAKWGEQLGWRR